MYVIMCTWLCTKIVVFILLRSLSHTLLALNEQVAILWATHVERLTCQELKAASSSKLAYNQSYNHKELPYSNKGSSLLIAAPADTLTTAL